MKMKKLFLMMLAVIGLAACTNEKKNTESNTPRVLVLYYSQTGATAQVARELQSQLDADIEVIEVEEPYAGTFEETIARCQQEKEAGVVPAVKPIQSNLSDYDLIFLGYPVWFGTYASPIAGLVRDEAFEGKKIVTFCTFGSGGLQASTADLQAALPQAEIQAGYGVRNARIAHVAEELNRFLIEGGYKAGEIDALPAFMEHHPVSEQEVEVFNEACADYQFPLGTPVDVAVRQTATATDYEFTSSSTNPAGEETLSTIYVTLSKSEGSKAEFTQVIR